MAISRTIRDALDALPGRAKALAVWDGTDFDILSGETPADGNANIVGGVVVGSMLYDNGWYKEAGNASTAVLSSAARTASIDSGDQNNRFWKGLHLIIDVTSITATPSITVTIQGKDNTSGKYYTVLASAAITTVSTTVLKVHPGLTAAANSVANDFLPRHWRVSVVNADADSITYSISANLTR